ncbi:NADPH-dependent FMN reductase [Micrococcus terreus]|uniref:NADPH-dependent FMN reductase n=1 Tax=Micrococcus terreus TaxID=574650 RepID=UPI003D7497FB
MRIGIVIGSVREGRFGEGIGAWVKERADALADELGAGAGGGQELEFEVLDVLAFDLPIMRVENWAERPDAPAEVVRWRDAVAACDGFVFITPEYNRTIPGAFKNAYDLLSTEWRHKPFALVSYGGAGGVRAQETWRVVAAAYEMVDVGASVALIRRLDFPEGHFERTDHHDRTLGTVLTRLVELTRALGAA